MVGQDGAGGAPTNGRRDHLRNLAGWLTLIPLVLLTLFCSGQVSGWGLRAKAAQDVQSQLTANYELWPYEEVAPMDPAVLDAILREDGQAEGADFVVPGFFLPTPPPTRTRSGTVHTPTAVVAAQNASPTSTQMIASATPVPLAARTTAPPTQTKTLAVPSATQTPSPSVTLSLTPAWTVTVSPTAARTMTATFTRTVSYPQASTATRI